MLFKETDRTITQFHIADPAQTQSVINVDIRIPAKVKKAQRVVCDFTGTGIYAGMSKVYSLK